jgi:molybdenum cofactor cytidylyltransferase
MSAGADAAVAGVILAAGQATRFGGPKLTMPFGDSSVIGCVVSALRGAGVAPIIVVASAANRAAIEAALRSGGAQIVENPDPARGMLSSVQVGVGSLPQGIARFLIALADQPRVTAEEIGQLLAAHQGRGKGIALPTHGGKRGHPVVFTARYREEILALPADARLRDVIHHHRDDIAEVEFASDAFVRDIDTQERYESERRKAEDR